MRRIHSAFSGLRRLALILRYVVVFCAMVIIVCLSILFWTLTN
jgi:hypothetical protein